MRTNIVLNDELLREALRLSGARSKRAVVEEALRTFVEVRSAERRKEAYKERVRRLEARLRNLRFRENPSSILRADRERP
jgi:Arc/MetJ family transcription regulator